MTNDWTPAIGWRKAIVRIVLCSAASMGVSLGGALLMAWLFGKADAAAGGGMQSVPWPIWLPTAIVSGFIGGLAVSWKLVENTSLIGGPILAATAAALVLAHLGTYRLAVPLLGARWEQFLFLFVIAEGAAAVITAGRWILLDS